MIDNEYLNLYLRGLLFVTLNISAHHISTTIGCEQRKLLDNRIFKQFLLLFIIYFTINYTYKGDAINPIYHIINTLVIWIIYLMFEKMSGIITLILVILLFIAMLTSNYINYYKILYERDGVNHDKLINTLNNVLYVECGLFIIILLYGFIEYTLDYKKKESFKFNDFLFKTKVRC